MPGPTSTDPWKSPAEVAIERLIGEVRDLDDDRDRVGYLLLVLGLLAGNAPEVLHFLLDRAKERIEQDH